MYTHRLRFGSADSTDQDYLYIFETMPTFAECKEFCKQGDDNRNIATIVDGVVADCFKGLPDETNNALLATFDLHDQEFENPVTRTVPRNVLVKAVRATRIVLSLLSRTSYRTTIKTALKSYDQGKRVRALRQIDFDSLELDVDTLKTIAFQLGQSLALNLGTECYSKSAIKDYFPELAPLIDRKESQKSESASVLNELRDQYVESMSDVYVRTDGTLNLFCYISSVRVKEWIPFTMQSRGTIVDVKSERCVAFPYDKFFKWNEVDGWTEDDLSSTEMIEVVEKMDGSFVTAFMVDDQIRFACKGSFDAEQALKALEISQRYDFGQLDFSRYYFTFEVMYPENCFPFGFAVVDYGAREWLCMTGARDRFTHRILDYSEISLLAEPAEIPVPEFSTKSLAQLLDEMKEESWKNIEGWVANFEGKRVKLKTSGYAHLNAIGNQVKHGSRRILKTYFDSSESEWNDLLATLPTRFRTAVQNEADLFDSTAADLEKRIREYLSGKQELDIKELAPRVMKEVNKKFHRVVLRIAREHEYSGYLRETVLEMLLATAKPGDHGIWELFTDPAI